MTDLDFQARTAIRERCHGDPSCIARETAKARGAHVTPDAITSSEQLIYFADLRDTQWKQRVLPLVDFVERDAAASAAPERLMSVLYAALLAMGEWDALRQRLLRACTAENLKVCRDPSNPHACALVCESRIRPPRQGQPWNSSPKPDALPQLFARLERAVPNFVGHLERHRMDWADAVRSTGLPLPTPQSPHLIDPVPGQPTLATPPSLFVQPVEPLRLRTSTPKETAS